MRQRKLKLQSLGMDVCPNLNGLKSPERGSKREEQDCDTVHDESSSFVGIKTKTRRQAAGSVKKQKRASSLESLSSSGGSHLEDSDTESVCDKKHVCKTCGATFSRPWRLKAHQRTHTTKKPFKCDSEGCLKAYAYSHHLDRHKSRSHSDLVVVETIPCSAPGCHMLFRSALNLRKHYKRFHDDAAFPFSCPQCDAKFRKHRLLTQHMYQHTGEAPFKCKVCEMGFTTQGLLNRHARGHREYICDIPGCDRKLPNQSAFRKHKAEHNACFTSMQCAHCNKEFKSRPTLIAHVKTHLGEGPVFKCTHGNCDRVYYQKRNLTQHIRLRHEKLSNFKCSREDCGRVFTSQKKLDIHTNWHINGPAAPRPRTEPRARRKDAGTVKRAMAVKLSGLLVPYSVEKQLLKDKDTSESNEEKSESHIYSECEQSEVNQNCVSNTQAECSSRGGVPDGHCEESESPETKGICEDLVEREELLLLQPPQLSNLNVSEDCGTSSAVILDLDSGSVLTVLRESGTESTSAPSDGSQNGIFSKSSVEQKPVPIAAVIERHAVPVTSNQREFECPLAGTELISCDGVADSSIYTTLPDASKEKDVVHQSAKAEEPRVLFSGYSGSEPRETLNIDPGLTTLNESERFPVTPNQCIENTTEILLVIPSFVNTPDNSVTSSNFDINSNTIVEVPDDLIPTSFTTGVSDRPQGSSLEVMSVAVVPSKSDCSIIESPCCKTKSNLSTTSMKSTMLDIVSTLQLIKGSSHQKRDGHNWALRERRKNSAIHTNHLREDLAVHQLSRLLNPISSTKITGQPCSLQEIDNTSSDCVMDLPAPATGQADDQDNSEEEDEDVYGESHDENSDSDRDEDYVPPDDSTEEEHGGGEGNGGGEEDGDDEDDDNENNNDDEDGEDEDDDENDDDDDDGNHGAQEQNDGNDDNNNSNDSNCDSSSDGNRTIGEQTGSESSNDSHSFGDGSDMGVDRPLPPVTDRTTDVMVGAVKRTRASDDEEVNVEDSDRSLEGRSKSEESSCDSACSRKGQRTKNFEDGERVVMKTEVSLAVEKVSDASEQPSKQISHDSVNEKQFKPAKHVSDSVTKVKNQKVSSAAGCNRSNNTEYLAVKELSGQQRNNARCGVKRYRDQSSDGIPPAKRECKNTTLGSSFVNTQASGLEKNRNKQLSSKKVCSELKEEMWLNILRQTKDLWKVNESVQTPPSTKESK